MVCQEQEVTLLYLTTPCTTVHEILIVINDCLIK